MSTEIEGYKGRCFSLPHPVDIYKNLNKDCISVRSRSSNNYGRIIAHVDSVVVKNPEFIVQEKGLEQYKKTGVKNVHAFVRGEMINENEELYSENIKPTQVTYNPANYDNFVTIPDEKPIKSADISKIDKNGSIKVWDY